MSAKLSTTNITIPAMGGAWFVADMRRFQDFPDGTSTFSRRLIGNWVSPRTFAPSSGRGNRSSMTIRLSKPGGTGTSRISCLGCTNDGRRRTEEGGRKGGRFGGFVRGQRSDFLDSDSSCGEGKGYSNREEGSDGVPMILEGECNLMSVAKKVMPFGLPGIAVTSSAIWKKIVREQEYAVGKAKA